MKTEATWMTMTTMILALTTAAWKSRVSSTGSSKMPHQRVQQTRPMTKTRSFSSTRMSALTSSGLARGRDKMRCPSRTQTLQILERRDMGAANYRGRPSILPLPPLLSPPISSPLLLSPPLSSPLLLPPLPPLCSLLVFLSSLFILNPAGFTAYAHVTQGRRTARFHPVAQGPSCLFVFLTSHHRNPYPA